ncbi:MAG: hypothetical protein CVV02_16760 [Firmicutes bacterium HGW-Firmicutes-7]|nr:MAG: hypothetical protein CVV02_16760 [Firmicutes bacterium HGW-Firmicutes-7]
MKSSLMQKHGVVAVNLARELISKEEGDRLETVAVYAEKFGSARGTVQSALSLLKENNAIKVQSKGHLGSYLTYIDYKKLWEYTDFGNCLGVMPLPYSKLYEGLATGLYQIAEESVIPFNLAYMRGSKMRVFGVLDERYDFAIMSKYSAKECIAEGMNIECIADFGGHSYVNKHALILSSGRKGLEDGMKIAIDKTSMDISSLTKKVCAEYKVEYVEMPYNQIIKNILSGNIEGAVWSIDEILDKNIDLMYLDINSYIEEEDDTAAVIVVKSDNEGMKNFIKKVIDVKSVLKIQQEVVQGVKIPRY